jgi:hypothetical protein
MDLAASQSKAMASANRATLFGRLEEIRANIERARADVVRLRNSIKGPGSVRGERTSAGDMRIQLRQSLCQFDDLLLELTPIAEHLDQPIRTTSSKKRAMEVHHA